MVFYYLIKKDYTVKGGTYYPVKSNSLKITVKKHLRAQEIAKENRLLFYSNKKTMYLLG